MSLAAELLAIILVVTTVHAPHICELMWFFCLTVLATIVVRCYGWLRLSQDYACNYEQVDGCSSCRTGLQA